MSENELVERYLTCPHCGATQVKIIPAWAAVTGCDECMTNFDVVPEDCDEMESEP